MLLQNVNKYFEPGNLCVLAETQHAPLGCRRYAQVIYNCINMPQMSSRPVSLTAASLPLCRGMDGQANVSKLLCK
ncbi:jg27137, partial [Pararge aegeria aegeria]